MNGIEFERLVANLLRDRGLTVYRSAASHGCADLVVLNPQDPERPYVTIQCKKHGKVKGELVRQLAQDSEGIEG